MQAISHDFGSDSLANYEKKEIIGRGTYGEVYKGIDKRTNDPVALKKVLIEMDNQGFPSTSIREISILREINHKNIVSLYDVVIDQKLLYLVFEYCDRDLKGLIQSLGPSVYFEPQRIKVFGKITQKMMFGLLSGIANCHIKRVIHRDLTPGNLLIDKKGDLKIADFGLARTYSVPARPYSHEVVTLWYRAPQILLGYSEYSTPIDIWSIGCIFCEMVTKKPLFQGDSEIDQLFRIFRILGTPNDTTWPGVTQLPDYKQSFPNWAPNNLEEVVNNLNLDSDGLDLLKKMLKYDPNFRITAKRALQHVTLQNNKALFQQFKELS